MNLFRTRFWRNLDFYSANQPIYKKVADRIFTKFDDVKKVVTEVIKKTNHVDTNKLDDLSHDLTVAAKICRHRCGFPHEQLFALRDELKSQVEKSRDMDEEFVTEALSDIAILKTALHEVEIAVELCSRDGANSNFE